MNKHIKDSGKRLGGGDYHSVPTSEKEKHFLKTNASKTLNLQVMKYILIFVVNATTHSGRMMSLIR